MQPQFQDFKSLNEISRSVQVWYEFMAMEQVEEFLQSTLAYVDIRDVTLAHVESLKKEAAGGHRIILSAGLLFFLCCSCCVVLTSNLLRVYDMAGCAYVPQLSLYLH